jgi:methylated-DNA-[protein]-cysteine S-methyltransferase
MKHAATTDADTADSALYSMLLDSPVGALTLAADTEGLRHIEFAQNRHPVVRTGWRIRDAHTPAQVCATLDAACLQLSAYFAGRRKAFDLPLALRGTPFQCQVWRTLARIPFGATWSYGELARAIGMPTAVRAVGAANGRNPLPIVLPCHRVIGSDRRLVGFGGGLPVKAALLKLEGARDIVGTDSAPDAPTSGDLFD